MGLPLKELPRQLQAEIDEWVWPGDEAVDLEASDLDQWVRHGGDTGLVMLQGGRPTKIAIGPLSDRAFRRVYALMRVGTQGYLDEAFRYGCRGLSGGGARVAMGRLDGIPGLPDDVLDTLGGCQVILPWGHLHTEMLRAMGSDDQSEIEVIERSETSLPVALGMVVLARTFRLRRARA